MLRLKEIAYENNLCGWIAVWDHYEQGTSGYALHAERKWRSLLFVPRYFDLNVRQMSGSKLSLTKFQTLEKMFFYCDLDYIYVALTYVRQHFIFLLQNPIWTYFPVIYIASRFWLMNYKDQ